MDSSTRVKALELLGIALGHDEVTAERLIGERLAQWLSAAKPVSARATSGLQAATKPVCSECGRNDALIKHFVRRGEKVVCDCCIADEAPPARGTVTCTCRRTAGSSSRAP